MSLQTDGIYLREWDQDAVVELGGVEVEVPEDAWHDLKVELKGTSVTVKLDLDGASGVETIDATTSIPSGGDVGLGVGALAEFRFKGIETDKPVAGGVDLRYHYDAAGRVVGRTLDPGGVDEQSQYFIYDDDRIMLELDGTTGAVVAEWVYGTYIDEIVAMYRDTDPGQPGFETHYYIQDDLYNVVALTDEQGNVLERYTYDDYGAPTFYTDNGDGTVTPINDNKSQYGNFFLFNGRRWDEVLELYDYRTRYYDPAIGRFLRIDTIGPWGDNNNLGNPYTYVGNNPWTFLDPYGEQGLEWMHMSPEQAGTYALSKFVTDALQFLFGGRPDYENNRYVAPEGGPGGVAGGVTSAATFRLAPTETHPSELSAFGMEVGAPQVLVLNPLGELLFGATVTGISVDPEAATANLMLDVVSVSAPAVSLSRSTLAVRTLNVANQSSYVRISPSNLNFADAPKGPRLRVLPRIGRPQMADNLTPGRVQSTTLLPLPPKIVRHHIFNKFRGTSPASQKYRNFFKKHGIEVDDFVVEIPDTMHRQWIHRFGNDWTTVWKRWIDANPGATTKEVYQQAGKMMDEYGLSGLPLIPYR